MMNFIYYKNIKTKCVIKKNICKLIVIILVLKSAILYKCWLLCFEIGLTSKEKSLEL